MYNVLPFFHIAGLLCDVYNAFRVDVTIAIGGSFNASRYWKEAASFKATYGYLLYALVNTLWAQPPKDATENTLSEK